MSSRALLVIAVLFAGASPIATSAQIAPGEPPRGDVPAGVLVSAPDALEASVYAENRETRKNIEQARDAGQLTRRQARKFRKESQVIDSTTSRYARDGLSQSEARELDMRARALDSLAGAARSRRP